MEKTDYTGNSDTGITIGSFGLFFTMFLLFCKLLPVLSITELKEEAE